jgi:pyridoxal phosphate enzyme (YggS family)
MNTLETRLEQIRNQIRQAELCYHRPPGSVTLVAVSKQYPSTDIMIAFTAGQRHFAENYLQEAIVKITETQGLAITWHFIGAIQSNKVSAIAKHFAWVHCIDRATIATALNKARSPLMPPLNVCIQLNINNELTKAGISPQETRNLALAISKLPNLRLRGLMCLPIFSHSVDEQRHHFAICREIFTVLKQDFPDLDTLSMGMSNDLDSAIAECSTMVRVGTAIFGPRILDQKYSPSPIEANTSTREDKNNTHKGGNQ